MVQPANVWLLRKTQCLYLSPPEALTILHNYLQWKHQFQEVEITVEFHKTFNGIRWHSEIKSHHRLTLE